MHKALRLGKIAIQAINTNGIFSPDVKHADHVTPVHRAKTTKSPPSLNRDGGEIRIKHSGRALGNGQEVPDFGQYEDKDWSDPNKGQAAMISRMDGDIGRILDLLDTLNIAEETIVMFTSDNGPHNEGGHDLRSHRLLW